MNKKNKFFLILLTLCFTMCNTIFSHAYMNRSYALNIEMVRELNTASSTYLEYYMTISGEKFLYDEKITYYEDKTIVRTNSVKIDGLGHPILDTKVSETNVLKKEKELINSYDDSIAGGYLNFLSRSSCDYQPHTEAFRLRIHKLTLGIVQAAISTAIGLSKVDSKAVSQALVNLVIGEGRDYIPDSIYFSGERCVSKSSGKIFYRYRGDFYLDSSESDLLISGVKWSRRWGH